MKGISFKPKDVVRRLLKALPERAQDVLESRYGLGKEDETMTLEAIGERYDITRERVRQIENHALLALKKSPAFKELTPVFSEVEKLIDDMGGVVSEEEFLGAVAKDKKTRNHVRFLLVLGDSFKKAREDEELNHHWFIDDEHAASVRSAIKNLYKNLSDDELIPEGEIIKRFLAEVQDLNECYRNEEVVRRWLSLSKRIGRNPLGEWGASHSPNVRAKGIRDYAYLAIKRHGSPMHFREVAELIAKLFNRRAHEATCHNELIKDKRFVLVGRGLYALSEWGYQSGIVRDVIKEILKKNGPLTRQEIIDKVLKERYVKENTIAVNLQNPSYFKKGKDGRYVLA